MLSFIPVLALLSILNPVLAAVEPTEPDSQTVVKVGSQVTAEWNEDLTGSWTQTQIDLMTGDNLGVSSIIQQAIRPELIRV